MLGVVPDAAYQEDEVALERGDRIVLYTDGMTEAMGDGRELFGEERLAAVLREHRNADPTVLQQRVVAAVTAFCGGEFQDDATVLVAAIDS